MIPVLEESRLFENQPRYALLLSWQIVDESILNLTARGFKGDNIVPLPGCRCHTWSPANARTRAVSS